jgi:hypothetical protein
VTGRLVGSWWGKLVVCLFGWLVGRQFGLLGWLVGQFVDQLVGSLVDWLLG